MKLTETDRRILGHNLDKMSREIERIGELSEKFNFSFKAINEYHSRVLAFLSGEERADIPVTAEECAIDSILSARNKKDKPV